jgi:hypothetical protein
MVVKVKKNVRSYALAFSLGVTLALLSSFIECLGPEEAPYGNLCGSSGNEFCMEPVLNGGFPLPYLFDMPGVSRERYLGFFEDHLRKVPFVLDVAFFSFACLLVGRLSRRMRSSTTEGDTK